MTPAQIRQLIAQGVPLHQIEEQADLAELCARYGFPVPPCLVCGSIDCQCGRASTKSGGPGLDATGRKDKLAQ